MHNDTFHDGEEYTVAIGDVVVPVPVTYTEASALLVSCVIPYDEARSLVTSPHLTPVRLSPRHAVLTLVIFDYQNCAVGPYREFAVSVPVVSAGSRFPYVLPLLFEDRFPTFGFFTVMLAMTTDIARAHSEEIFHYPTFEKNIEAKIVRDSNMVSGTIRYQNSTVFSISLPFPSTHKSTLRGKRYRTYVAYNGRTELIEMVVDARVTERYFPRATHISSRLREFHPFVPDTGIHMNTLLHAAFYEDAKEILYPQGIYKSN